MSDNVDSRDSEVAADGRFGSPTMLRVEGEAVKIENADGTHVVDLPDSLANLLIEHRDWHKTRRSVSRPEPSDPERCETQHPDESVNNEAACDDDLPEGVVFADSAYMTVVDKKTGEEIRVLKTHCVNKHKYAGENVKIRVRDGKAHRECQTCLKARRARASDKEKAQRAAAKQAPARKAAK